MRLAAALVGASFASLATAVSSAAIYELNNPSPNHGSALEVSPNEARLALAQKLGLTKYYELEVQGANDRRIQVLERMGSGSGLFEQKTGGQMMISLAGVIPEDAGSQGLNEAMMTMKDSPSEAAAKELVSTLAKERSNLDSEVLGMITLGDGRSFCATTPSIRNAESIVSASKIANYKSWEVAQGGKVITQEILDVFKPERDEDRQFMNEYLMFEAFADHIAPKLDERSSYAFCHLMKIQDLVAVFGRYSPQVKLAVKLYHDTLSKIKTKTLVLLTPPTSSKSATYDTYSHRRRDVSETPLSMAKPDPKPAMEAPQRISKPNTSPWTKKVFLQCYTEEETCTTSTNSCSGHGKCVKRSEGCWSCKCSPTVRKSDGGLKLTTDWAGYACQKQDISVPFNIFLIFGVMVVLVVGTAISMMYAMGSEPLPSVLAAGVAPMKRL